MRSSLFSVLWLLAFTFAVAASAQAPCHYLKSRSDLVGYETGGPYKLEHFQLTKGRTDLRDFLWQHWHRHIKAIAEARVGTVDVGVVTVLYIVQPNSQGLWGIDVEIGRHLKPPLDCSTFHADSLVRLPIHRPDEDYPSQTLGPYLPDGSLPKNLLAESDGRGPKYYKVILLVNGKSAGDSI
jgi:hypothetical protein